ncbi:hypothetical protein C4588_02735, partial [Candidatus Parcubacteria bacterium]
MKISNNLTPKSIKKIETKKAVPDNREIDMDVLSVLINNDSLSVSQKKIDPDVPDKEWYFQMGEPSFGNVTKGSGYKGGNSEPVEVSIIHTNDEHDNKFNKVAGEVTVLRNREKFHGDENSVMVNTGDISYEGSNDQPGPQYFGPMARVFNSAGMEFFVPGNHEFQHGGKYLEEELIPELNAKTLLGNVTYKKDGKPLEGTKPYAIEEVNGVKVGLVGLTTGRQATSAHPDVGFDVRVESLQSAARKLVEKAKADGAEIIVVLAHESVGRMKEFAANVPGVDVVVAGHDHKTIHSPEKVKNPDGRDTLVVEAASNCRYVGDMTLEVDRNSREITGVNYKLFSTENVEPDPESQKIIDT